MDWSVKLAKSLNKDRSLHQHYYITLICQIAIALCIATVLISSFMIRGFEEKIEAKIFNFWAHIRIFPLSTFSSSLMENPIQISMSEIENIQRHKEISHITRVANKAVILKAGENIEGIILKGIDLQDRKTQYNLSNPINLSYAQDEVPLILSQNTLKRLNAKIGSRIYIHILDSAPRIAKGKVVNIYFTNIEEFDNQIALSNIQNIQVLNGWSADQISWLEVFIQDIRKVNEVGEDLYRELRNVNVENIFNLFPQMFDWLALMKKNELIILIVMQLVAIINVMSTISIFILEKTQLVGMLKVLGARNKDLYKMLFYQIGAIILKGILIGNGIAIVITAILHYLKPIKLDPTVYYINYAPVAIDWKMWLLINFITLLTCFLTAWIPLVSISKISPIKVAEYK